MRLLFVNWAFEDHGSAQDLYTYACVARERFDAVIGPMGMGRCSPVVYRPLFDVLRLVTCRTFETLAADTIPVFGQDAEYVAEVYGEEAVALVLPAEGGSELLLEVVRRPERYAGVVQAVRRCLAARYSYAARVWELIDIIQE